LAVSDSIPAFYSFFNINPFRMKKEKKAWAIALVAFWWVSPNQINAQQQDSVRTLDEVVITATRIEQPVIEVPRSVSIISRDMIERSVFNSVGELLSSEAGIYVVGSSQTPGTNQSIFMRGANSNQVVVMIDGMRITDPSLPNGSIDFSEISISGVEKIEIIRGSHSTLFGGSAIGGAINIITKKASSDGFHGSSSIQTGTFGSSSVSGTGSVNLNYKFGNGLYVTGNVVHQKVRGLNATEDTIKSPSAYKTNDHDDFDKTDFYLKSGFTGERFDFSLAYRDSRQTADIDDRAFDDDDNAYLDFTRGMVEYSGLFRPRTGWNVKINGSFSDSKRYLNNDSSISNHDGIYDRTFYDAEYNGQVFANEMTVQYVTKKFDAVLGFGDYSESMDFRTFYFSNAFGFPFESIVDYDSIDTSASTKYVFAQAGVNFGRLNLKAGTRFNHHSLSGDFFTFEFSPSWKFGNRLLYSSLSTGYNAPSLYQLFDPTGPPDLSITRGNSQLKAERSMSLELGYKQEFDNGSFFTISGYSSDTRDGIEYVYLWNKDTPVDEVSFSEYITDTYLNVSRQKVYGLEVSGRVNVAKFYLLGNVSALKGRIYVRQDDISAEQTGGHHVQLYNYGSFVNDDITISSLARRPQVTFYTETGFKWNQSVTIYSIFRHTSARNDVEYDATLGPFGALAEKNVRSYNLVDVGVNWQIAKRIAFNVKVENLTAENYREINGFQTRGRSLYGKIFFKW
jgi:vitamin B12 transporter